MAKPLSIEAQTKLREAREFHQRGDLARAGLLYQKVLQLQPRNLAALFSAASIAGQSGNPKRAVELFDKAIAIDPAQAAPYCNRGLALQALGQCQAALESFDEAIARKADYALAYYNRGNVLRELSQPAAALASYDKALALHPGLFQACLNRGLVLQELGDSQAALAGFDKCLALKPDYVEARIARGNLYRKRGEFVAALASFDRAILMAPNNAAAHLGRGALLEDGRHWKEALASYDQAIALTPRSAEAHVGRGRMLKELDSMDAALASCEYAIAIDASDAEAHCALGTVLHKMGRLQAALCSYDRAIASDSRCYAAWVNRGNALQDMNRLRAALDSFDRAIDIDPEAALARVNKSIASLLMADWESGWLAYEWRSRERHAAARLRTKTLGKPLWEGGASLVGRTILLHAEQGLGDTIQFSRYAQLVADLGANVLLQVQEPLVPLLGAMTGVSQVLAIGGRLPDFDCHCPLMSLPRAFNTTLATIPARHRYIDSDPGKLATWRSRWQGNGPRIGLVWSGNPQHGKDRQRSIPLAELMQHLPAEFGYVSLQTQIRDADLPALASNERILNVADELCDFSDTAALCDSLDLVVSVDTSVAHLSGALGKKTWILVPFSPDWRWLLDRSDSPWYPTATLYRQRQPSDWSDVLQRVTRDLRGAFPAPLGPS